MGVALAPLPVRGQEVEGVDSSCRPLGSLLVPARAVCGRGLLTATARGVGALGLAVTGLDPWIDTGHTVSTCGVTGGGLLTAPGTGSHKASPYCHTKSSHNHLGSSLSHGAQPSEPRQASRCRRSTENTR